MLWSTCRCWRSSLESTSSVSCIFVCPWSCISQFPICRLSGSRREGSSTTLDIFLKWNIMMTPLITTNPHRPLIQSPAVAIPKMGRGRFLTRSEGRSEKTRLEMSRGMPSLWGFCLRLTIQFIGSSVNKTKAWWNIRKSGHSYFRSCGRDSGSILPRSSARASTGLCNVNVLTTGNHILLKCLFLIVWL